MIGYNEKGKPKYKTFTNKQRAIVAKRLAYFIANKEKAKPIVACNQTISQWLDTWYNEYVVNRLKISTRVNYESIIKNHIKPYIGHIKLVAIKKTDIEAMFRKLAENGKVDGKGGLSVKSMKGVRIVLHAALEEAYRSEYIIKNPASIAMLPTLNATDTSKKEIAVLSRAEQKVLLLSCDDDVYGAAIFTALHTGVRLGELLGLQWDDIDFENKTVRINKQVNRLKNYDDNAKAKTCLGIQNSTKTAASNRVISMSDPLANKLKRYKEVQEAEKRFWGNVYNDLNMVFARIDGNYMDPSTFRDRYRAILKKAGLKPFTVHALRHTFATRALEAGIAIKVVSKLLGHTSIEITMDTYSHVLPDFQSEAMNRIAEYYEEMA